MAYQLRWFILVALSMAACNRPPSALPGTSQLAKRGSQGALPQMVNARMIHGVGTVIYQVNDLARARAWYAAAFQHTPYFDEPFYVGFNIGGYELGLDPDANARAAGPGGSVAYWRVDSLAAALTHFTATGAGVITPTQDVGGGVRLAIVADPFGNLIGLIENPAFQHGDAVALAEPPPILQVHREVVRSGLEGAYSEVEGRTARLCVEHGCPHPYLAVASLTGPTEVWFFNGYRDAAEHQRVEEDYQRNRALLDRLRRNADDKASLIVEPRGLLARYQTSIGATWTPGRGRFLVITATSDSGTGPIEGSIFGTPDGRRLIIMATRTREEAEAVAVAGGGDVRIFAVRPEWSFPATAWRDADKEFWRGGTP